MSDSGRTLRRSYWDPAIVERMTPEQRAVMYGPNSSHTTSVPEMTVDADGTIRAVRIQR